MNRTQTRSMARLTHVLEMAIAACLLAALAVPAILFPAVQSKAGPNAIEAVEQDASSRPPAEAYAAGAQQYGVVKTGVKNAPTVARRLAVEAISKVGQHFEFSRRMVTASREVTDADVEELVRLALLGDADLSGPPCDELVYWNWLIHLEAVDLTGSQITDAALVHLARLPELQELNIANTRVTDAGFTSIGRMPRLNTLVICNTAITDRGLAALGDCSQFDVLDLSNTAITDESAKVFERCRNVTALYLSRTQITNGALLAVGKLSKLTELTLDGCRIDDEGMPHLAKLKKLQTLWLHDTQVSNAGIESLLDMEELGELCMGGTKVNSIGRALLRAALPECEITESVE